MADKYDYAAIISNIGIPNIWMKINSDDVIKNNNEIRNVIYDYTSGQQVNNITSLTQQAIQQAQQAATQQGG